MDDNANGINYIFENTVIYVQYLFIYCLLLNVLSPWKNENNKN